MGSGEQMRNRDLLVPIHLLAARRMGALFPFFLGLFGFFACWVCFFVVLEGGVLLFFFFF